MQLQCNYVIQAHRRPLGKSKQVFSRSDGVQRVVLHKHDEGGRQWGKAKERQSNQIDDEISSIISQNTYVDVEDLEEKLVTYKDQFITYDIDGNGELDENDVGYMMEKLGQPKNNLQIRKMIKEIDLNGSGTINFSEFVQMMLGGKSSILRKILMFEEMTKEKEKPAGPPPKKSFADLP